MKLILALGSNLGDREDNIKKAIALINNRIGSVVKTSSFHKTEPIGFVSDNYFINAVVEIKTTLGVYRVLKTTQKIEQFLGRKKKSKKGVYEDRIIDIDILFYSNLKIKTKKLTLPHPRMPQRDFVMNPLAEIKN